MIFDPLAAISATRTDTPAPAPASKPAATAPTADQLRELLKAHPEGGKIAASFIGKKGGRKPKIAKSIQPGSIVEKPLQVT